MRVAVVDTYYPSVLDEHYRRRPDLLHASYQEQFEALLQRSFGTADAYSWYLQRQGHEAIDLIANAGPLQRRWAADRGLFGSEARLAQTLPGLTGRRAAQHLERRILMAQLQEYEPDVVYLQTLTTLTPGQLDSLRRSGCLVVGQIASRAPAGRVIRSFDLIITSFPHFIDRFRSAGVDATYLPLAVDRRVLDRLTDEGINLASDARREHDLVFVGGVNRRVHPSGVKLLTRVCQERDVQVWGYGAETLPADSPILRHYRGEAYGTEMYRVLAQSRIVINRHIEAAEGASNNMRMYEATGVGALLLTDPGFNLGELFEPGREVMTYEGPDGLLRTLEQLDGAEDERVRIAAAGQARTLRQHTFDQRIRDLVAILESRLG